MRSASYNFRRVVQWMLLVLGLLAFATLLGRTQQQINPNTQIKWPANCQVYNVAANACPPVGGIVFRGAWSGATTYAVNDAVYESGSSYVSLQAGNVNHNPLTSPTFWTLLVSGGSATPGGANLDIQFNENGALGGTDAVATDAAFQAVYLNGANPTPNANPCGGGTPELCVNANWNATTQAAAEADPIGLQLNLTTAYPNAFAWGNPGPGGWSAQKGVLANLTDFDRGITQLFNFNLNKFGTNDTVGLYGYTNGPGGTTAASDEGFGAAAFQAVQYASFYEGFVNGTQATGATDVNVYNSNGLICDGCPFINRSTNAITGGYFVPYVVITAFTFDGANTFVFTSSNSLIVGQTVAVYGFASDQWINGTGTVTARSTSQFTLVTSGISHSAASATEIGAGRFQGFNVAGTAAMAQHVGGVALTPSSGRARLNTAPVSITSYVISGNVATVAATNAFVAGEAVYLANFPTSTFFNYNASQQGPVGTPGMAMVVLSAGLSSTHFSFTFLHANASATEAGTAAQLMPTTGIISPAIFTTVVDMITDSGYSAFPTTPNLVGCLTGAQPEQVRFTAAAASAGHQTISITYRQPHAGPVITEPVNLWYGGPCGYFIDQLQQTAASRPPGSLNSAYFVVGAIDSAHIAYAWNIRGGSQGNAISAYSAPIPYTTALRTGSTVTAAIIPGYNGEGLNGVAAATVIAATNSALLGTATSPTQTLNAIGLQSGITFTQAGTNGDTSAALLIALPNTADAFSAYCGAEVISPSTPSPGQPATVHLEPNNCAWLNNDAAWNPLHPTFNMEGFFINLEQHTPSNQGNSQGIGLSIRGSGVDGNFAPINLAYFNAITAYTGHGGTMNAATIFNISDPVSPNLIPYTSFVRVRNSGLGGAPFIEIDGDEFGGGDHYQSFLQIESGGIGYYNPTQTFYLPNLDVANITVHGNPSLPTILLGNGAVAGRVNFTNEDIGTVRGALQLGNLFGGDDYLCVMHTTTTCQPPATSGGYVPTGSIGAAHMYSIVDTQANNLTVGRGTPANPGPGVYAGAAGSINVQYTQVIINALGQEGNPGTGGSQFLLFTNTSTLGGGNTITFTCPAARQLGMASTDNYVYYSEESSAFTIRRVGVCPIGGTLVDSGAGTVESSLPVYDANAQFVAGNIVLPPLHGTIQWLSDIYHTTIASGISQPSPALLSFDSSTEGDAAASAQYLAAILTGATPTVAAGRIGLGTTTAAATNCNQSGVLSAVTACLEINVGGTARYVPYF